MKLSQINSTTVRRLSFHGHEKLFKQFIAQMENYPEKAALSTSVFYDLLEGKGLDSEMRYLAVQAFAKMTKTLSSSQINEIVDSIYDDAVYSIVTPTGSQPALSEVSVTSSNEAVLKKVDGHWKAVGEGEATLTISHPSTNAYWAGQTVEAHITVVKHTPVITWNLEASYPWGAIIESPVSSSNEHR